MAYPSNNSAWIENVAALGAARTSVTANKITKLPTFMNEADKDTWTEAYSRENATAAPINYYQAVLRGFQAEVKPY